MTVGLVASGSISRAAAARAACSSAQLLPAELEDVVGVEAVERRGGATSASWRSRPIAQSSVPSASVPSSQSAYSSTATFAALDRAVEATLLGGAEHAGAGRHDLVEEGRQLGARSSSSICLPAAGPAGRSPGSCAASRKAGDVLEPAGDRLEPLGERRVVAREQQEQAVADRVEGERPALPDAQDVGVEDRAAEVVELEVALEARRRRQRRPDRAPRPRRRWARSAASSREDRLAPAVAERSSSSWRPSAGRRGSGCRGSSRRKRASTRS